MELRDNQIRAISRLNANSILCGGVGSGKSRTALCYFYTRICGGELSINNTGTNKKMSNPIPLYIITTAHKRDSGEWEKELSLFENVEIKPHQVIFKDSGIKVIIDSWNNIKKYENIIKSFFIFDEQRAIGKGTWSKIFIKIAKNNLWLMLTATPGDNWNDYIPVFIARGYFKNRTDFNDRHCIFNRLPYANYSVISGYKNKEKLERLKHETVYYMPVVRNVKIKKAIINCNYDSEKCRELYRKRWDIYENQPITNATQLVYVLRRIVNSHCSRIGKLYNIIQDHKRIIVFYNFNYERDIIKKLCDKIGVKCTEWSGFCHEQIAVENDMWVHMVQYYSGAEGWNCIETNTLVLFSMNYSYKTVVQACGRINRLNTPFPILYYYILSSESKIDKAIIKALEEKKDFNVRDFILL